MQIAFLCYTVNLEAGWVYCINTRKDRKCLPDFLSQAAKNIVYFPRTNLENNSVEQSASCKVNSHSASQGIPRL